MQRGEVLLELKGGIELRLRASQRCLSLNAYSVEILTSCRGISGGPAAISADLVPGWMRRFAFASMAVCSISWPCRAALGPIAGDFGVIWISAGGGGLGSRGELGGSDIFAAIVARLMFVCLFVSTISILKGNSSSAFSSCPRLHCDLSRCRCRDIIAGIARERVSGDDG